MSSLDESEREELRRAASRQYGAVIYGRTPSDRHRELVQLLDSPQVRIHGAEVSSKEDFIKEVVLGVYEDMSSEDLENQRLGMVDVNRALREVASLLVLEFELMPSDVQTSVAQLLKGVAEQGPDVMIGYACEEPDSVVRAEFDLSGRIRGWEIE